MKGSSRQVFKVAALVLASAFASGVANAGPAAAAGEAKGSAAAQHWSAWGGTVGVRWNRELAADIGLRLSAATARHAELSWLEHETFDLRQVGSLEFKVRNGNLHRFVGGSLQARGGYVLDTPAGPIDLRDFRLLPRDDDSMRLDLVGAGGKAWFYIDRLMYELIDGQQRLAVRTMDLRISAELAQRLGHPEVAGWAIADMELITTVVRQGLDPEPQASGFKWAGQPVKNGPANAVYEADLFMLQFSSQYSRCDGCSGIGGNGRVVFTPSSTLRNNVNHGSVQVTVAGDPLGTSSALYAADIPWWNKFSGNQAPYGNDQHPYLIWNLYRFNADGSIDQIGRSGVKHAFLTTNTNCLDNPGNSHVLGRGCYDTYSVGNNDTNNALGPRSEIIPATNQWGRCGSIYDLNCDGLANASGNGNYDQRLVVRESQFSGPAQAGASYLFESWYLAREDVNILNSMATQRATFSYSGALWNVGGQDQHRLGPAIDRWVDPAAPGPNAGSVAIRSAEGQVKVAARATELGGGLWRYHYAVMNLDFARARTQGAEPNLRVLSNRGLNSFSVPVGSATISDLRFGDGDLDAANDWTGSVAGGDLRWVAPVGESLDWGTLYRFSFTANRGPQKNGFILGIAEAGLPQALKGTGLPAPAIVQALGPPPVGRSAESGPGR